MLLRYFNRLKAILLALVAVYSVTGLWGAENTSALKVLDLGSHRELFADHYLIDSMSNVSLMLHKPEDEGGVLEFNEKWEGPFSAYCTVIHDGNLFRLYYRGKPKPSADGVNEVTCVAESTNGVRWVKPALGLVDWDGSRSNNIVLAVNDLSHNFSPMLDSNPEAKADERYKAISGTQKIGIYAFVSPDGLRWKKLQPAPVLTMKEIPFSYAFDSQNVAFWSAAEKSYLLYFRVYKNKERRIARAESADFIHWKNIGLMEYHDSRGQPGIIEELYTSQTSPYFRAPQIYVAIAARFMLGRQVISAEEAKAIHVNPSYFKDTSDAIFMTSRGDNIYDRTFMSGFIWPGIGPENWVSRTTYPALNVIQTGPAEMSIYANQNYAQPTSHLERYRMRLDGFSSVRAPYEGGEFVTKPFTFSGNRLMINFATSAAGDIRAELQDTDGKAIPGFALKDNVEIIGNEIDRTVRWHGGNDLSAWAGRPVRLRFIMKDADLYALRFAN
jgi:hypothetical protein